MSGEMRSLRLTDLKHSGLELLMKPDDLQSILHLLFTEKVIDPSFCFWNKSSRLEIPVDAARRIGRHLEQKFFNDLRESMERPTIPDFVRPIATSNGLWIDAALPLLNRHDPDFFYLRFANFCQICSGFSIG